jgi:type I restriction enzyme R subunit
VIEELIALAKEMRKADRRGEALGLSEEELAFYDALAASQGPQAVLADDALRHLAQELIPLVRANVTVDWTVPGERPRATARAGQARAP